MLKTLRTASIDEANRKAPPLVREETQNINDTLAPPEVEMTELHFLQNIASFSLANSLCLIIDMKLKELVQ
jgi:hypothetical protein